MPGVMNGYRDGYGGDYRHPGMERNGYGGGYNGGQRNGYGGGPAGLELQREETYRRGDPYNYDSRPDMYRGDPLYGRRGPRDNYATAPADVLPLERHEYVLDHLATFTVGSNQDLLYPEDGMRKLRQMEMTTGIWTMQVTMQVESRDLVIVDRQTEDEMERFPLSLINDPTAVTNEDRRDIYNNILLFTVMGDNYQRSPSEMHIFQCKSSPAENVVGDLRTAIHVRSRSSNRSDSQHSGGGPGPAMGGRMSPFQPPRETWPEFERAAERSAMATAAYLPGPSAAAAFRQSFRPPPEEEMVMAESIDRDVQILNHCFDDIEKFVGRLQHAAEQFRELDRRRQGRDRKRGFGDGMLTMRARPPPAKEFIEIFQKFKLAFNLLAKLKKHIHDPNAPELVHFLITPLSLIVEASKDPGHGTPDLASKVVSPLLTADARELLKNCLTSKETDLWMSLGDAWTVSRDQWKGYVPPYSPRFSDGWNPEPGWYTDSTPDVVSAAIIAHQQNRDDDRKYVEDPYSRREVRTPPRQFVEDPYTHSGLIQRTRSPPPVAIDDRRARSPPPVIERRHVDPTYAGFQKRQPPARMEEPIPRAPPAFAKDQQAFRNELLQKGGKIVEVMHEREGRNPKEMSVQKGEYLEVLDESRNWWKLRNSKGVIGHAPYTILSDLYGAAKGHGLASNELSDSQSEGEIETAVSTVGPRLNALFSRAPVPSHGASQMSREQHQHSSLQRPAEYSDSTSSGSSISFDKQLKADLRRELKERVTSVKSQLEQHPRHHLSHSSATLSDNSGSKHVIAWLKAKGFKARTLHKLEGATGRQMFEMDREMLERLVGREEGARLDSQLTVQRNLAGYQTGRTKELKAALQRQKDKTDSSSVYDSNFTGSPFTDGSFYYNFKTPQ